MESYMDCIIRNVLHWSFTQTGYLNGCFDFFFLLLLYVDRRNKKIWLKVSYWSVISTANGIGNFFLMKAYLIN